MKAFPLLAFLFVSACASAQLAPTVYAESFRHGSTSVLEQSFEVQLTPRDPVFAERIKDAKGFEHYRLAFTPHGPEGDTEITSWQVRLVDLKHTIYDNLLRASPPDSDDSDNDPRNSLWRLDPSRFAPVRATARRVIKVDGFYILLQIKSYHFTPPDSPYLDSMEVFVRFTNSDPRAGDIQK
jgi:hypothetical protein